MAPTYVTPLYVWSDYPGMRPGRVYAGKPDLYMRPKGEAHLVAGPDAAETLCGRSRTLFPYDFPDVDADTIDASRYATRCDGCRSAAQA